jgi:hypothetical protein
MAEAARDVVDWKRHAQLRNRYAQTRCARLAEPVTSRGHRHRSRSGCRPDRGNGRRRSCPSRRYASQSQFDRSTQRLVWRLFNGTFREATMYHLLATGLAVLIFAFGTATSIATTKALQNWAISALDTRTGVDDLLGLAPRPMPSTPR